eukprot:TRINITY_DN98682_c0_g1_i1.p2 TRINITY_DN98682_c0_g1~~TRINITY_DN98682_c0_g1_i1.p2  ORF type:complete len:100 (-),score=20.54 TRINITY_DN98682_c0_g1_i1:39-338(-)
MPQANAAEVPATFAGRLVEGQISWHRRVDMAKKASMLDIFGLARRHRVQPLPKSAGCGGCEGAAEVEGRPGLADLEVLGCLRSARPRHCAGRAAAQSHL